MNQLYTNFQHSPKLIKINYLLQNSKKNLKKKSLFESVILKNNNLIKNQGEILRDLSKDFSLHFSLIEKPINLLFSVDQFLFEFSKKTYQQKKTGEFFQQLKERKKLSFFYGHLTKKQIINIFDQAKKNKSYFSKNVFSLLERRLDVVVYRSGITKTISHARQLIKHKKIFVNKNLVTIPSFLLNPGDIIEFTPQTQEVLNQNLVKTFKAQLQKNQPKILGDFYSKLKKNLETQKTEKKMPHFKRFLYKSQFQSKSLCDLLIQLLCTRLKLKSFWYIKNTPFPFVSKKEEKIILLLLKWKSSFKSFSIFPKKDFQKKKNSEHNFFKLNPQETFFKNQTSLQKQPIIWSFQKGKHLTGLKINNTKKTINKSFFFEDLRNSSFLLDQIKVDKKNIKLPNNKKLNFYRKSFIVFLKHLNSSIPFLNLVTLSMKKTLFTRSFHKQNLSIRKNLTFRIIKPIHLEISYNLLTIIYLYSPQRINFPFYIDLDLISRSLR